MTVFIEGDLQLEIPSNLPVKKFDDPITHKLSSFMKAVDFVVETSSHLLFIEFKDPENASGNAKETQKWVRKFLSGSIDSDLKYKYRDTWIYEWSSKNINKPVIYLILIACKSLTSAELTNRTDQIRKNIPVFGPTGEKWSAFVEDCLVFNIEGWNKYLPDFPISRISALSP